jgi:SAM-dependent methyltransferase
MDGGLETNRGTFDAFGLVGLPEYLVKTYGWAYLTPASVVLLDNRIALTVILWGNLPRLVRAACEEFAAGQRVLQAASAYGNISTELAETVGAGGQLEVIDIAPLQVRHLRRKLVDFPQAQVRHGDAAVPAGGFYDGVCCFFLLHEVPDDTKRAVVDALLGSVPPGGRVVFVDYHRPVAWHPLRSVMHLVFRLLEPYAFGLIETDIAALAGRPEEFSWRKEIYFGGLYQKVVAVRKGTG